MEFSGNLIPSEGVSPVPQKVCAIPDFVPPKSLTQLRKFLSLINCYHRFIPNCATIFQPLICYSQQGIKQALLLHDDSLSAVNNIKQALADGNFLAHPSMDAPYYLAVDASMPPLLQLEQCYNSVLRECANLYLLFSKQ